MNWQFHNPVCIRFGPGGLAELAQESPTQGATLLLTSPGFTRRGGTERVISQLGEERILVQDDVAPNPDLHDLEARLGRLRDQDVRKVIAVGGGSVLDTAKVLAVSLSWPGFSLTEHLTGGASLPARRTVRLVMVPTTAGTGSEVTPFATVWDLKEGRKYSLAGDIVFPDVAILDPHLTLSLPWDVTMHTGLDAVTQALESIWSRRANPVTNAWAAEALRCGLEALPGLKERPADVQLRAKMLEASLLAGLSISQTRTALCHSMSYPITAKYGVPHGLACAFTVAEVYAFNCEAEPERFEWLARTLGLATAEELGERLERLMEELGVAGALQGCLPGGADLAALVPEMLTPGRSDNNMRATGEADVAQIVAAAARRFGLQ